MLEPRALYLRKSHALLAAAELAASARMALTGWWWVLPGQEVDWMWLGEKGGAVGGVSLVHQNQWSFQTLCAAAAHSSL